MKKILLFFSISLTLFANGQNYLGVASSNYSGVMGTDLQPASFVDGRFVVDVNLFSGSFNLYQNGVAFDTKDMPKWWIKSFADTTIFNSWAKPDSTFSDRYLVKFYDENSNKKLGVYSSIQIDALNFMFHIKPTIAVGFSAKTRAVTNLDDVDSKLAVLAENSFNYQSLWGTEIEEKRISVSSMAWTEYALHYAQVAKDDNAHFFKIGGKAKFLSGLFAGYFHSNDFKYKLQDQDTSLILQGNFDFGYSENIDSYTSGVFGLSPITKHRGLGLDFGVVYEWRPDWQKFKYDMDGETNLWRRDKDKYKLKVGASLLDLGAVKFTTDASSKEFSIYSNSKFDLTVLDNYTSVNQLNHFVDSMVDKNTDWNLSERDTFFYMQTPAALSLQVDYHIWNYFYINATGLINLHSRNRANTVHAANQFSLTPSFDYKWFGLHVPLSVNSFSGFKAGLATRLGPLTLGMTDFRTMFATGKVRGAEFYMGLRVPVLYGHPSDQDNDKVSDGKDACETVPGVWAFKGCPDSDSDGIQDMNDNCPQEAGLAEFQGCPDRDGDKVPDKDDNCPDTVGLVKYQGCPDTDGDGIIDGDDDCPTVAGLLSFKGCPDTDGDGIKDDEDACPEVAGPLVNQGCPDTDKDGLFDFLDDCPEQYGPKENKGCPWPDTDNDGLLDKDDECPNLAGPIKNKGCPYQDTDNDGVLDKDDDCPATAGPASNKGCPVIEKEVEEILKTAFDNLEFETGKDIIKESSLPSLSELAAVLRKKSTWNLQISGHTDNVGDDQKNLILSKKRAEAVKNYMMTQGIDATRLYALYFGETMPIATNDTPEGRQKNRRVEMKIIFK
jgi:outer membrane protein OmpA-like peptidoglycan-associated protein